MNFIVVNFTGILFILGIVYWFWIFKPKAISSGENNIIDILVDGGTYTPSTIQVKYQNPTQLRFLRKDPNPCAEWVIFDELNISQTLSLNKAVILTLPNDKKGEFEFTCQMGMYRGKIIVE